MDFIWIGLIMNNFYKRELSAIARKKGNRLNPNLFTSALVYILLAGGIAIFVLPSAETNLSALLYGALIGLIIYGVYDLTNFSTLKNFSLKMAVVDLMWGTFLCGVASLITKIIL